MFAFAIWDRRRRRLFAARDRVGKKPFVYAHTPGGDCAFSSELASLVASPGFVRAVDETALHHYLTYQFVPSPRTIWSGAKKLPGPLPGREAGGAHRRWWDLHYVPKLRSARSPPTGAPRSPRRCACAWSATCRSRTSPAA
jgi:asparagine synthase (glutamine-hydrolysing)